MVIKVYISGISGNKEVKKRQQRVLLILDSKNVKYEVIDIAEPGAEEVKDFMQNKCTSLGATISDPSPRHPLPPQIFNDDDYCGDYDQFDMANEIDEMEKFLKLESTDSDVNLTSNAEIQLKNGEVTPDETKSEVETKEEGEIKENEVPNEQEKTESEEKSNDAEVKGEEEPKENEDTEVSVESKNETEDTTEAKSEENTAEGAGDKAENEENSKTEDEKADEA
ncbi:SH3 domain-binding glutamic acid-rich protein homolog [Anoplophora glabripennis]|uniref:SH3 domain-binding glutamic acid-rich protein homolog n=1 Tax=Anoplophora glabripennis TaxID=217634 RepID=UPI000874FAB6|nr:SH3 domain-binding glutamic acid-rich protein homolog [Anoplophora glabripennis]